MLLVSIITTVVCLAFVWLVALGDARSSYVGVACLSLAGMVLGFCIGYPVMFLTALLVGILAVTCAVTQARRRSFCLGSLAAVIMAFGIVIVFFSIPEQRQWASLETAYPVQSLEGRLPAIKQAKPTDGVPARGAASSQRLNSFEAYLDQEGNSAQYREISLRELHSSAVNRFIQSRGFGVGRLRFRPTPEAVPLDEPEPIPMPVYDVEALGNRSTEKYPPDKSPNSLRRDTDRLHENSLLSFLNPITFGYVEDIKHVTGFQPHAFRYAPSAPRTWHIDKLELVSLLKHEEPAVYLSEHLPRMSELRDAPTRPLDDFEKQALAALQKGEDVQVQTSPDQIRMLGAIRAVKQCLKCHDVERGYLLGAFAYDLRNGP